MKSQAVDFSKKITSFLHQNSKLLLVSVALIFFIPTMLEVDFLHLSFQMPAILCFVGISAFVGYLFSKRNWYQSSRKLYQLIAENLNDIVILHRLNDGKSEFVNATVNNVLGFSQKELIGQSTIFMIHPKDQAKIVNQFSALTDPDNFSFLEKVRIRCKDGEFKWMELSARSLRNGLEKQAFAIFTFRDISETIEQELANKQFAQELFLKYMTLDQKDRQPLIPSLVSKSH